MNRLILIRGDLAPSAFLGGLPQVDSLVFVRLSLRAPRLPDEAASVVLAALNMLMHRYPVNENDSLASYSLTSLNWLSNC